MGHVITVSRQFLNNCSNIKKINYIDDNNVVIFDTNDINSICVFIEIKNDKFVCQVPNLYYY